MQRKLIKQGLGGITIYLPKSWIDKRSLSAGDDIVIQEMDDKLILSSTKLPFIKEITIILENESPTFLRNSFNQIYRRGYDVVKIKCKTKNQLVLSQKLISLFWLGFEITSVDEKNLSCVAQNFSEPSNEKISVLVRRVFYIVKESLQILLNDSKGKELRVSEIKRLTKNVTQYDNFCRRTLYKSNSGFGENFMLWEILSELNLLQHIIFHIYKSDRVSDIKKSSELLFIIFTGLLEAFYTKNILELDKFQVLADENYKKNDLSSDLFRQLYILSISLSSLCISEK